jgi:hypothetical protein
MLHIIDIALKDKQIEALDLHVWENNSDTLNYTSVYLCNKIYLPDLFL